MSPEIIRNKDVSFSTDLWSLGVRIYELMTRVYPFSDVDSIKESTPPLINGQYSDQLKNRVFQMLSKKLH
jgi:serine/threonine protein kinase